MGRSSRPLLWAFPQRRLVVTHTLGYWTRGVLTATVVPEWAQVSRIDFRGPLKVSTSNPRVWQKTGAPDCCRHEGPACGVQRHSAGQGFLLSGRHPESVKNILRTGGMVW
jgi:hypothetical protein